MQPLCSPVDCRLLFAEHNCHECSFRHHLLCRMSQENKGEDPKNKGDDPIETDIQDCRNRITKLEGDLDAARQKSPINEAYIKFLNEELPKLHERLGKLRDKQAGAGVGRSPQSRFCVAGCALCLCMFVSKVYVESCSSSYCRPLCCIFENLSYC